MQTIAQSFLVLHLTGSAFDVGLVVALQTLPVLLLGPYAGVVADRVDKRRLMIILQSLMGVQALVFGVLTITNVITLWQIGVLAVLLGLNNTFENPARQTFVLEMVGPKDLRNAVTLELGAGQRRAGGRSGRGRHHHRGRRLRHLLPRSTRRASSPSSRRC